MNRLTDLLHESGFHALTLTEPDDGDGSHLRIEVSDDCYISVYWGANLYHSGKGTVQADVIYKGAMDHSFTGGSTLKYVRPERVVFLAHSLKRKVVS
jgi:hypothetical protein